VRSSCTETIRRHRLGIAASRRCRAPGYAPRRGGSPSGIWPAVRVSRRDGEVAEQRRCIENLGRRARSRRDLLLKYLEALAVPEPSAHGDTGEIPTWVAEAGSAQADRISLPAHEDHRDRALIVFHSGDARGRARRQNQIDVRVRRPTPVTDAGSQSVKPIWASGTRRCVFLALDVPQLTHPS